MKPCIIVGLLTCLMVTLPISCADDHGRTNQDDDQQPADDDDGPNLNDDDAADDDAGDYDFTGRFNVPECGGDGQWSLLTTVGSAYLYDIWGTSESDIYLVGSDTTIVHYNGDSWTLKVMDPDEFHYAALDSVWGSSATDVYVGGGFDAPSLQYYWRVLLHYDGETWTALHNTDGYFPTHVWGSAADDIYLVGDGMLWHYDGQNWTDWSDRPSFDFHPYQVWGGSTTDVYFASGDTIVHYDGLAWTSSFLPMTPRALWSSSPQDVTAVETEIWNFNGEQWQFVYDPPIYLMGVWGFSKTNIFAVGAQGMVVHYDGLAWTVMDSGTTSYLYDVWGTADSNLYASGSKGQIFHYTCE